MSISGGADVIPQALAAGYVDEPAISTAPLVLGGGKRLFPDDGQARTLRLDSTSTSKTGVLICSYRPAGD